MLGRGHGGGKEGQRGLGKFKEGRPSHKGGLTAPDSMPVSSLDAKIEA